MVDDAPSRSRRSRLEQRRRRRHDRYGRYLGLSALGTLIPGAGLLAAGRRKLGGFALTLFIAGLALVALVLVLVPLDRIASYLGGDRQIQLIAVIVLVAAAVFWLLIALATQRSLEPDRLPAGKRLVGSLVVILSASVVVAPLAFGARTILTQRGVIDSIAGGDSQTTPTVDEADPWADIPRLNVLLLGGDDGAGRTGVRPDTQMVASIDTHTGATTLISLPRNLQQMPFPEDSPLHEIYPDGWLSEPGDLEHVLFSVYENIPAAHPEVFEGSEDKGADANKWAVSGALGIDVHYYIRVNLQSFEGIVDALGGVTLDVPRRIPWGNKSLPGGGCTQANGYIEPGADQHLDGFQALWFARSRCGADDYDRMARQQCVIDAIVGQIDPATLATKYQSLAGVARENIVTDVPENMFQPLIDLMLEVQGQPVESLPLDDKFFDALAPGMTSSDPDYDLIHAKIAEVLTATSADDPATGETTEPDATDEPTDTTEAESAEGGSDDDVAALSDSTGGAAGTDDTEGEPDAAETPDPDQPHDTEAACSVSAAE